MNRYFLNALCLFLVLAATSPAQAILQKGERAPAIKVVTTSGQHVTLNNYAGYVLVLDFFATWCSPCRESIPYLISLNRRYGKQGLQILGMSVDDSGDNGVREFIAGKKISYPVAMADEDVQTDYSLRSVPTLYIISKKGIVAEKYQGFNEAISRSMEIAIKRLLAE